MSHLNDLVVSLLRLTPHPSTLGRHPHPSCLRHPSPCRTRPGTHYTVPLHPPHRSRFSSHTYPRTNPGTRFTPRRVLSRHPPDATQHPLRTHSGTHLTPVRHQSVTNPSPVATPVSFRVRVVTVSVLLEPVQRGEGLQVERVVQTLSEGCVPVGEVVRTEQRRRTRPCGWTSPLSVFLR